MSAPGPSRATAEKFTAWETPPPFYAWRDSLWHFGVDAAANAQNALCERYFGPDHYLEAYQDALAPGLNWAHVGDTFWCNPPYGAGIEAWIRQFRHQAEVNRVFVEALIPANTATRWFAYCAETASDIELLTRRINFWRDGRPVPAKDNHNTTDSMLVRWRYGGGRHGARIVVTNWAAEVAAMEQENS